MPLRRVIGVALAALFLTAALGVAPVAAATTYTDPAGRFSFTVPDGYAPGQAQLTPPLVAAFVAADPAGANVTVQVRDTSGSLDAATAELQKRYATASESEPGPGGIQPLTLGGKPAQRFDYFTNAQGSRFHIAQVVSINGSALYIITLTAREADYDTLIGQTGVLLSSFTFLSAGASGPSAQISNGTAVYSDPQGRFSFTVPIDFESTDPGKAALEYDAHASNGNLVAFFYMFVDDLTGSRIPSFNALVQSQRDFLRVDRKYTILSEQGIALGGETAYRFDVTKTSDDDGTRVRSVFMFVLKGQMVYQITWVSTPTRFDEYAGRLQSLISSFSFSATPNPITPPSTPANPPKPTTPAPPTPPSPAPPTGPPAGSPPPPTTGGRDAGG